MACLGQILNFQGLVFIPNIGEITALGFKIEIKNSHQCLGGIRMENQGVQKSPNLSGEDVFLPTNTAKT